jgi:hypothetical protein
VRMRCEQARELLPELAEPGPRAAGPVERHVASCAACSEELHVYRTLLTSLAAIREHDIEPPAGALERAVRSARRGVLTERLPSLTDVRRVSVEGARALRTPAAAVALASLGGAAVGAAAIGLVWWRLAKRAVGAGNGQSPIRVASAAG